MSENLLNRNFSATVTGQAWVSAITARAGPLYQNHYRMAMPECDAGSMDLRRLASWLSQNSGFMIIARHEESCMLMNCTHPGTRSNFCTIIIALVRMGKPKDPSCIMIAWLLWEVLLLFFLFASVLQYFRLPAKNDFFRNVGNLVTYTFKLSNDG